MTYRQLLEAIQMAQNLQRVYDDARCDSKRWNGTIKEQDEADAKMRSANEALDIKIEVFP